MSDPVERLSRAEDIRNPLLRLLAAQRLLALPPDTRQELAALFHDLVLDARDRAEQSWRRNKAPMATYWKAVSVYAGHLRRLIRRDVDHQRDGARQ